ncbi:MAG TPA: hypothetical protein VIM70_12390 [Clostridium sp.]|uniref:hypothetical protein n=1 Tax=Clostridium sp. TaxID=1506 RepID=UPI002F94E7BC
MIQCICCKESYDNQFMIKFETLDSQAYIKVCDSCSEEHSEYDEENDSLFISWSEKQFYPSGLL